MLNILYKKLFAKLFLLIFITYGLLFITNFTFEQNFVVNKYPLDLGIEIYDEEKFHLLETPNPGCDIYELSQTKYFNEIHPLGCQPNSLVIETLYNGHEVMKNDRYGFLNDDIVWDKPNKFNNYLVGDSLTRGCCELYEYSPAKKLNNQNINSVNLGIENSSPLQMLATLREYVPVDNKGRVFFIVFENEILNMERKHDKNPLLTKYLNDRSFSQHLTTKNKQINNIYRSYYDSYYSDRDYRALLKKYIKLNNIRIVINYLLSPKNKAYVDDRFFTRETVKNVLGTNREITYMAKDYAEKINKEFIYVFIPSKRNFFPNQPRSEFVKNFKKELLKFKEDMLVIDFDEILRNKHNNKNVILSYFSEASDHLSPKGAVLFSNILINSVKN